MPPLMDRIYASGATALYDAVRMAIEQIRDKEKDTALVVLTDGEDNCSVHTLDQLLKFVAGFRKVRLHIVHVSEDGMRLLSYEALCSGRGHYRVVSDAQIVSEIAKLSHRC